MMIVGNLIEFLPCHCKPPFERPPEVADYEQHAAVCDVFRAAHRGQFPLEPTP